MTERAPSSTVFRSAAGPAVSQKSVGGQAQQ
jgi:hypothetical protein